MYHDFTYEAALGSSQKANWALDDVLGPNDRLDFGQRFLPEALVRTTEIVELSPAEQRVLNQICGHQYLCLFGLIEEFILPFILDHARPHLDDDDYRVRAMLQFAGEEAKHIQLFRRFHRAFTAGFEGECEVIGPAPAIGAHVLAHAPLSVALVILHIEWMTQSHYTDSVRDDDSLDPLFKSLLRHHWMEEAQHAKLDTLMVEALAEGRSEAELDAAIDGYLDIGTFLDAGLSTQTELNLAALERSIGRELADKADFVRSQHQAARWTYLGSGMTHPKFRATLGAVSPPALARIDAVAPVFC